MDTPRTVVISGASAGGRNRGRARESIETACRLNAGDADAHVEIALFFTNRDPAGP